eukprot:scaffold935_cov248-Pinguiococcus_pyrenoidosus.AAC.18
MRSTSQMHLWREAFRTASQSETRSCPLPALPELAVSVAQPPHASWLTYWIHVHETVAQFGDLWTCGELRCLRVSQQDSCVSGARLFRSSTCGCTLKCPFGALAKLSLVSRVCTCTPIPLAVISLPVPVTRFRRWCARSARDKGKRLLFSLYVNR